MTSGDREPRPNGFLRLLGIVAWSGVVGYLLAAVAGDALPEAMYLVLPAIGPGMVMLLTHRNSVDSYLGLGFVSVVVQAFAFAAGMTYEPWIHEENRPALFLVFALLGSAWLILILFLHTLLRYIGVDNQTHD